MEVQNFNFSLSRRCAVNLVDIPISRIKAHKDLINFVTLFDVLRHDSADDSLSLLAQTASLDAVSNLQRTR